ncbi:shikimate kinase, partial [Variovorax sp. 2RAF20]
REVADFIIETGKPSVAQLANMVLMQLEMAGFVFPPAEAIPDGDAATPAAPDQPAQDTHS